jgi:ASC-1-like (ASCH) protein
MNLLVTPSSPVTHLPTIEPKFNFKPYNKERMILIETLLSENVKVDTRVGRILKKIKKGNDKVTGRLLFKDDHLVGLFFYQKKRSKKYKRFGIEHGLIVKSFFVNETVESVSSLGSKLLEKAVEKAKEMGAKNLVMELSRGDAKVSVFLLSKGFSLMQTLDSKNVDIFSLNLTPEKRKETSSAEEEVEPSNSSLSSSSFLSNLDKSGENERQQKRHKTGENTVTSEPTNQSITIEIHERKETASQIEIKQSCINFSSSSLLPHLEQQEQSDRQQEPPKVIETNKSHKHFNRKRVLDDNRRSYPVKKETQYINNFSHSTNSGNVKRVTIQKKYLNLIKDGKKTIEGRINSGMFRSMKVGNEVCFFCGHETVYCKITKIERFQSFDEMLQDDNFKAYIPDAKTRVDAVRVYDNIPSFTERARVSGVLAIYIEKVAKA